MSNDARKWMDAMRADVTQPKGSVDHALRALVFAYAGARARGEAGPPGLPDDIRDFVEDVVAHASRSDVEGMRKAGRSDEHIYEIAVCASVAAGSERGVRGLAALNASTRSGGAQ